MSSKTKIIIPPKCEGCIYGDICQEYGETCEYYHSHKYEQQLVYCEYQDDIDDRVNTYNEVIKDLID